jgi:hypothetical protein
MALPHVVEKIDSVAEAFRSEYKERDGKFYLDVSGAPDVPDVNGLKSALTAERESNKSLKDTMKAWAALGKKPDEVQAMLESERAKADEALVKAGKVDELLERKVGEVRRESDTAISEANNRRDSALGVARKAVIGTHVNGALVKAKVTAEGLDLLSERLGHRVQLEFDDKGSSSISILDAAGEPMLGSGQGGRATFDDLVKEASKTYPSLFEGTGGGGSGTRPRDGGGPAGKTLKRSDYDALSHSERATKMREGFKVVD